MKNARKKKQEVSLTLALIPAFSPGRRRIIYRRFDNTGDGISRMISRKMRIGQKSNPLLGERIQVRASLKTDFHKLPLPLDGQLPLNRRKEE